MVSAAAALLDELMGRDRNLAPTDKKHSLRWDDAQVCKHYLVNFCPNELFINTRADLGPCEKLHDETLKKDYEKSSHYAKMGYEDDFMRFCQSMLSDVDRRIRRGKQRLALEAQEGGIATPAQVQNNEDQIKILSERINGLLQQVEALGCDGKVEEAQGILKLCDQLKDERETLQRANENSHWMQTAELAAAQEKQMEVCEVCGAFLIVGDAQQRVDDHLMGKQHMGYAKIKAAFEEILDKRQKVKEEREKLRDKEREERMNKQRTERQNRDRDRHNGADRRSSQRGSREGADGGDRRRDRDREREKDRSRVARRSRSRSPKRSPRSRDRTQRSRSKDRKRSRSQERNRSGSRSRSHRGSSGRDKRRSRSRSRERDSKKTRRSRSRSRSKDRRRESRDDDRDRKKGKETDCTTRKSSKDHNPVEISSSRDSSGLHGHVKPTPSSQEQRPEHSTKRSGHDQETMSRRSPPVRDDRPENSDDDTERSSGGDEDDTGGGGISSASGRAVSSSNDKETNGAL